MNIKKLAEDVKKFAPKAQEACINLDDLNKLSEMFNLKKNT